MTAVLYCLKQKFVFFLGPLHRAVGGFDEGQPLILAVLDRFVEEAASEQLPVLGRLYQIPNYEVADLPVEGVLEMKKKPNKNPKLILVPVFALFLGVL